MSRRRWSDYPSDYRAPQLRELAGWIAAGQSGSLVGMGGAGKSNLLGFLANRPDALAQYLPAGLRALVVLVDLNSLPATDLATVYRLLLRSFHQVRGQLDAALRAEIERIFEAHLAERDPFVVQTVLLDWLARLGDSDMHIALAMDRFDRFAEQATPELTDSLRALRDIFKGQLCLLAGMRQPVTYLPDPGVLGELQELLDTRICWLGPMNDSDAHRMSVEETAGSQPPPSERELDALLRLSGNYPALLKAACHWSPTAGAGLAQDAWLDALLALPTIRARIDEIWQGLTQAEQAALTALADPTTDRRAATRPSAEHHDAIQLLELKGLLMPDPEAGCLPRGELLAAHARAQTGQRKGRLTIDPTTGEVLLGATPLRELTNLERGALTYLLARPRARVAKTELIEGVWPDDVVEDGIMDDALYQVIRGLRVKIEPEPGRPRYLVTWRGRPEGGYQLFPEGRPG